MVEHVSKAAPVEYLQSSISDNVDSEKLDEKTVYPDVIIHDRVEAAILCRRCCRGLLIVVLVDIGHN
jgi:hypothetical protein